jgi:hypothetical protein
VRTWLVVLGWESVSFLHFVFPLAYAYRWGCWGLLGRPICNQLNRVNCSAFHCRAGNFRLGCLPEAWLPNLHLRGARGESLNSVPPRRPNVFSDRTTGFWSRGRLFYVELRAPSGFRHQNGVFAGSDSGSRFVFGSKVSACRYLWKWLFYRHSYFRLKMALWML